MHHINDYTLVPGILYSLQPGGHPQLEAGSEGRRVGRAGHGLCETGKTIQSNFIQYSNVICTLICLQ